MKKQKFLITTMMKMLLQLLKLLIKQNSFMDFINLKAIDMDGDQVEKLMKMESQS
jgi:hypothetical protein